MSSETKVQMLACETRNLELLAQDYTKQWLAVDKNPHQSKYLRDLAEQYRSGAANVRAVLLAYLIKEDDLSVQTFACKKEVEYKEELKEEVCKEKEDDSDVKDSEKTFSEVLEQDGV